MFRVIGRRVSLGPPNDADLEWIMASLGDPKIARALGYRECVGSEIYTGYVEDKVLLLPYRNKDGERVGFIMTMRPDTTREVWTVNVAVPELNRRNGFTTIVALDALTALLFDVRGSERIEWLIEPGNGASRVLPKRLGYAKIEDVVREGTTYGRYAIDERDWASRKERLGLEFEVEPVPLAEVAHGRVIAAIRAAA